MLFRQGTDSRRSAVLYVSQVGPVIRWKMGHFCSMMALLLQPSYVSLGNNSKILPKNCNIQIIQLQICKKRTPVTPFSFTTWAQSHYFKLNYILIKFIPGKSISINQSRIVLAETGCWLFPWCAGSLHTAQTVAGAERGNKQCVQVSTRPRWYLDTTLTQPAAVSYVVSHMIHHDLWD